MLTIGDRISEVLKELGISQAELAKRSGVSPATISRYIGGERENPRVLEAAAIARALGVSLAWLYDATGPKRLTPGGDPELASFQWPPGAPEAARIAVQVAVLAEREAHRRALIPYWHERMRVLLDQAMRDESSHRTV